MPTEALSPGHMCIVLGVALHMLTLSCMTQTRMAFCAGVRTWLRGSAERLAGERSATPSPPPEREHEREARSAPPPGEPAPLWRSVQDRPRVVTSLALAPRRAAIIIQICRYSAVVKPILASKLGWHWRQSALVKLPNLLLLSSRVHCQVSPCAAINRGFDAISL